RQYGPWVARLLPRTSTSTASPYPGQRPSTTQPSSPTNCTRTTAYSAHSSPQAFTRMWPGSPQATSTGSQYKQTTRLAFRALKDRHFCSQRHGHCLRRSLHHLRESSAIKPPSSTHRALRYTRDRRWTGATFGGHLSQSYSLARRSTRSTRYSVALEIRAYT